MTSHVDVFADRFPDRHQLTLGMMWRCRDSTTTSEHLGRFWATQGHSRWSLSNMERFYRLFPAIIEAYGLAMSRQVSHLLVKRAAAIGRAYLFVFYRVSAVANRLRSGKFDNLGRKAGYLGSRLGESQTEIC